MRQLQVTRNEIQSLFGEAKTFGELLKCLETEFQKRDEVICKITLNGMELTDEEESQKSSVLVDEILDLHLVVAHPNDLLKDVLHFWCNHLPKLEADNRALAEKIRFEGFDLSFTTFVKVVESCQELVRSLVPARNLLPSIPNFQEEQWNDLEKQMWQTLSEVFRAFESKDFILLSDLLEYDLGKSLTNWTALITQTASSIDKDATSDKQATRTDSGDGVGDCDVG